MGERILIAGAGGTLGLPLTRRLIEIGDEVIGLTRSPVKAERIQQLGARAVVVDALKKDALTHAVREARPDQVVNLLTALPPSGARRARDLAPTNRLRVEGSKNLLEAAAQSGVRRVIAESFLAVFGRPHPAGKLSEADAYGPIERNDPLFETVQALRSLEHQHFIAQQAGKTKSVVLRFGFFYGPSVSSSENLVRDLVGGRLRVPVRVSGMGSWIHIDDAVSAVIAILRNSSATGSYHVVDDRPLPLHQVVLHACEAFGVRPPGGVPIWALRLFAPVVASMITAHLALDNQKIKNELDWAPRYSSVQEGFLDLASRWRQAA